MINIGIILPQLVNMYYKDDSKVEYVHVLDLPKSFLGKIKTQCDICGRIYTISYCKYNTNLKNNNGIYKCFIHNGEVQVDFNVFKNELLNFYIKTGKPPTTIDIKVGNYFQHGISTYNKAMKSHNLTLMDLCKDFLFKKRPDYNKSYYHEYIKTIKENIDISRPTMNNFRKVCQKYNTPSYAWFIRYCPDKTVKNYSSLIEWMGLKPTKDISKNKATEIIYSMQNELDRPLIISDFVNPYYNQISISVIERHWKTFNNMKKELDLEIVQENMIDKQINIEEAKQDIKNLCNNIYQNENRTVITVYDINSNPNYLTYTTYAKYFIQHGSTLSKYINSIGFKFNKSGCGLNYKYKDGEKVVSQYEYQFSNYLRFIGLIYNKDYFRDVRYTKLSTEYEGNMNCDYEIHFQGRIFYVEIAGFLRDYQKHYMNNQTISISAKEEYKLKLKEKEEIFINNDIAYYILFPSTTTRDLLDMYEVEQIFDIKL